MAVAMMVDNPHGSHEIYERVRQLIGLERPRAASSTRRPRAGCGWRVIEVWESAHRP